MTFINPRAKVLRHVDRIAGWNSGAKPAPVTIEWDLSNRCVLGCQDCHFAHTHSKGPWTRKPRALPMAFDQAGDLADMDLVRRGLGECAAAGVRAVVWSGGGEPTVHPRWQTALNYATGAGLEQGMYSLGGLFTQESARHAAQALKWIVISLDCADAETYAAEKGVAPDRFNAAIQGIRWLVEAQGATVGVSYLLHEKNWERIEDMVALTRSLGGTYTMFRPTIQTSPERPNVVTGDRTWINDALPYLWDASEEKDVEVDSARFEEYRDWTGHGYTKCHGIRLNATITPDGRVWICPQRRGVTLIGDLREESFAEVWSRHSGEFAVNDDCRVSCRLHALNQTLNRIEQPVQHQNFL